MDKTFILHMTGYVLVLTASELNTMLRNFPDIWEAGIRRGKRYARTEKALSRGGQTMNGTPTINSYII